MKANTNGAQIDLQDVTKAYEMGAGNVTVLDDISLRVQPGEFVSVVGPSGSGKSTLLNVITGIDRPTAGRVYVDGKAVHELGENGLARWRGRNVGIIFQFFQLLPALTILENVMLPMELCRAYSRRKRRARGVHLLERVGIAAHAHKLPRTLSGGQQQRAAIARAMANDPSLIVGDEPTGNLDSASAAGVFSLFGELAARGKTLVIVTHDRCLSAQAERVIHLRDGRLYRDEDNGRHADRG
jgi:putative ABC transport system ATP-binding protein